jgi:hypothetical protein
MLAVHAFVCRPRPLRARTLKKVSLNKNEDAASKPKWYAGIYNSMRRISVSPRISISNAAPSKCDISLHLSPSIALAMLLAFSLCLSVIDYSVGYEQQINRRINSVSHGTAHF